MINVKNMRFYLAALRSRKYKQCYGKMYCDDKCCALGVAGKIFNTDDYAIIRQKLGIDLSITSEIITKNDNENRRFYQIARWLERKFKNELSPKG